MPRIVKSLRAASRKVIAAAKLIRDDPELLGRNLSQFTNRSLFEQRLINVLNAAPMHVRYDPKAVGPPTLNVLDSAWTASGMTGGPNTVINLACRVALEGVHVRFVSTIRTDTVDTIWLQNHAAHLIGKNRSLPELSIVSSGDPKKPLKIGDRDIFLATHWTTAHQLREVLSILPVKTFFYMIQEFEPGFYPWSSNFARSIGTYNLDFWPIINESVLADFLLSQPYGRLNQPIMRKRAMVFEPAVDAALFYPTAFSDSARPRRLLFYARPTNSRNMFGLGLMALRRIALEPAFQDWEFVALGSPTAVPKLALGRDRFLRIAPWVDYASYGNLLRDADILLCPMLSPHTSYPVLEMAACGGLSVTNTFATKTAAVLNSISPNIIGVEPTVDGFAEGLLRAANLVDAGAVHAAAINMPRDWDASLGPIAKRVATLISGLVGVAG